jgi:mono/diheme cytochrome c family protein
MRISAVYLLAGVLVCGAGASCGEDPNMKQQAKKNPLRPSTFFPDGASARPRIEHTVTRVATAWEADEPGAPPPAQPQVSMELLQRGRERYEIFCSMCHGRDGYGQGMVVQRGFPPPPSLHDRAVLVLDDAHYYRVIRDGLGKMPPYRSQIPPADRLAIIAYVRALQLSQNANQSAVPAQQSLSLRASPGAQPLGTRP